MSETEPNLVEEFFKKPEIHNKWEHDYRTEGNEEFYQFSFKSILRKLKAPKGSVVLDAGCGSASHSIRLAQFGYQVEAIDFSENVLEAAREKVKRMGLESQISLSQGNNCDLKFDDESFEYVISWGVLMHIPDMEKAVEELARVVRKGGYLVLSENNQHSLESTLMVMMKKSETRLKQVPHGLEFWKPYGDDELVVRLTNIPWLIEKLAKQGLTLRHHMAGQFTELYCRFKSPFLQNVVHTINKFWFKAIKKPGPAFANILIFQKESASAEDHASSD